jgi:hypothetical protein
MRQRRPRSRTRRILRSRPLWLTLAILATFATTAAAIYLFGHLTELQEAAAQPTPWQQFATEATIRRWTGITLLCEAAGLTFWLLFAHAWTKSSLTPKRTRNYIVALVAAILGPGLLLGLFAIL